VERWNGTSFEPMQTPRGGRHAIDQLNGIASDGSIVWGVGIRDSNHGVRPLVEYLC
jgi:hypothetical protein